MEVMKRDYVERIYSGWLAKIIGIRLGAPVEGWSAQQIRDIYGKPEDYVVDYCDFAADDDSNGPIFFLRALEDCGKWEEMEAQDVAEALLNYAPYEHGFFWWGGYGVSTEHTAYLNLRHGIPAPRSGSIEQNGHSTAEQIGGQIFIDTWGLVAPGQPDLAAKLAKEAASVTHGGNGVYGGIFVAVCISYAFVEQDIEKIIRKGLSYLPDDCEYSRVVREMLKFHQEHPMDQEDCWHYIEKNFGYDRYPGVCHIIPNTAVMVMALLYGDGDFSDTLNICNRCGWDTDCNVGNIATIMGVRNGLEGINAKKWREPINDFLVCSSVMGSMNIMDIPCGATYIANLSARLLHQELPHPYADIIENRMESCHFEYPGSTHAIRVRTEHLHTTEYYPTVEAHIANTDESAATGERSLKVTVNRMQPGENVLIHQKTYYRPADFHDSRYDPAFSPTVYPGQTIHGSIMLPDYGTAVRASLYAHEMHTDKIYQCESIKLEKGQWNTLKYQIPSLEGGLIDEIGFCIHVMGERGAELRMAVLIDDLYADGDPSYTLEARLEQEEIWTQTHREISQFTKLRGLFYLEDGKFHLSAEDFGEIYTGSHTWKDYTAEFSVTPVNGGTHMVNVRVKGAIRSYAVALLPEGKVGILKNENGYRILTETEFPWEHGKEYRIRVNVEKNRIRMSVDGQSVLEYEDLNNPYLTGAVGISVQNGSHICCSRITVS